MVPAQDDGYAETEDLAEPLSRPEGSVARARAQQALLPSLM